MEDFENMMNENVFDNMMNKEVFSFFRGPITNKYPEKNVTTKALFKLIRSNVYKEQVEALRKETDPAKQAKLKSQLDYVTPVGVFTERNKEKLKSVSGMLSFDFDKKENPHLTPEVIKVWLLNDPCLHPLLTYISPRGEGLKLFIKYDPTKSSVVDYSHAVMQYLQEVYHLVTDKACFDIARACYLSYDPMAYYSNAGLMCGVDYEYWFARYNEAQQKKPKAVSREVVTDKKSADCDMLAHVQLVASRIQTDITNGDYEAFFRLCMSLSALGESGRAVFKQCCSFYGRKQTVNLDDYFDKCMHDSNGKFTIATFFEMAKDAGIDIRMPVAPLQEMTMKEEVDEMGELPLLDSSIYDKLPPLLQKITDIAGTSGEKGLILMTALSTLSAAMPHYYMIYGGDMVEANLFFFGLAQSGAGKGKMKHCLRLVRPIHDKLLTESVTAIREYKRKEEQLKAESKNKGRNAEPAKMTEPMPPYKLFIMTAESSAAAFMRTLYENGGRGIMFETEGDTLAYIFGKDYGAFSDKFRKIPHHEALKFSRSGDSSSTMNEKGEGTYLEIDHPCMSTVMSGTPEQLRNLIHSPENGLFNRFNIYYYKPKVVEWVNQYAVNEGKSYQDLFDEYARDVYVMYTAFDCSGEKGVRFVMSAEQEDKVERYFNNMLLQHHTLYDGDYDGTIHRLGLAHGRICMILTALRVNSVTEYEHDLHCSDEDLQLALEIISVLNQHSAYAFRYLTPKPKEGTMKNMPIKFQFYSALPDEFTMNEANDIGAALKISRATIYNYVNQFVKGKDGTGFLLKKVDYGAYRKVGFDDFIYANEEGVSQDKL